MYRVGALSTCIIYMCVVSVYMVHNCVYYYDTYIRSPPVSHVYASLVQLVSIIVYNCVSLCLLL
jgi:hypothetical protein